jgi:hypothetical protein
VIGLKLKSSLKAIIKIVNNIKIRLQHKSILQIHSLKHHSITAIKFSRAALPCIYEGEGYIPGRAKPILIIFEPLKHIHFR